MTEDEVVGWHHRLNGHEFEQALGVDYRQGSLACFSPWGLQSMGSRPPCPLRNDSTLEGRDWPCISSSPPHLNSQPGMAWRGCNIYSENLHDWLNEGLDDHCMISHVISA